MSDLSDLAARLSAEGQKFLDYVLTFQEHDWSKPVYSEEDQTWDVRMALAHLVTSERGLVALFETIRQGAPGASEAFSIDRYNADQQEKTRSLTPGQLLGEFRAVREDTVAWVLRLQPHELEISGRHPFLGQSVLREMIKMLVLHQKLHTRDIQKALA